MEYRCYAPRWCPKGSPRARIRHAQAMVPERLQAGTETRASDLPISPHIVAVSFLEDCSAIQSYRRCTAGRFELVALAKASPLLAGFPVAPRHQGIAYVALSTVYSGW